MTHNPLDHADPAGLARLLSLDQGADASPWVPEECAAVWRHQLSTPIDEEIGDQAGAAPFSAAGAEGVVAAPAPALPRASRSGGPKTFGQLLHDPQPPPDLLDRLRSFAKRTLAEPSPALPPEVAKLLYFASILAGLVRCGRRLTSLDDRSLRRGAEWCLRQNCVDPQTRALLSQGLDQLGRGPAGL